MARVLIIGCGGRGQALARELVAEGHAVRGTTRDPRRFLDIEATGAEPAIGDPDRIATLMDPLSAVTIVCWLMATAVPGELHTRRIRMLCEKLVDTPVRGLVYESHGPAADGVAVVEDAHTRWNIPLAILDTPPARCEQWRQDAADAVRRLLG